MTDANRRFVRKTRATEQGNVKESLLNVATDALVELPANDFRSSECYEGRRLVGGLAGTTTEDVQFEDGCFSSVDLSKTRWHKLLLGRTLMEKCDLANAAWTNANMDGIQLQKCRGTGLQFVELRSTNCQFVQSKLNLAAFHGSKLRGHRFEDCDLTEANFESVELTDVVFRNCDLRLARFPNCVLKNVDFRGSQLAGMQIEPEKLRGSCFDVGQLGDLAAMLGIVIKMVSEE